MKIAISGMIGCGKSTLSKQLANHYQNSMLLEELDSNDDVFNTFLEWIYQKYPNIDIAFQSYIIESISERFKNAESEFLKNHNHKQHHIFLDRFNVEHHIFATVTLEQKPSKYLNAFNALFDYIIDLKDNPDLAIFLDADFDVIKNRILKRGRDVEIENFDLNIDYFKRLHQLYRPLFEKLVQKYNIPYKIINTNDLDDHQVFEEATKIIDLFIYEK
ncbi:deoxynucleoside kinase [Mycoplasma sp. 4423]